MVAASLLRNCENLGRVHDFVEEDSFIVLPGYSGLARGKCQRSALGASISGTRPKLAEVVHICVFSEGVRNKNLAEKSNRIYKAHLKR